jgi:hypothetical protein
MSVLACFGFALARCLRSASPWAHQAGELTQRIVVDQNCETHIRLGSKANVAALLVQHRLVVAVAADRSRGIEQARPLGRRQLLKQA